MQHDNRASTHETKNQRSLTISQQTIRSAIAALNSYTMRSFLSFTSIARYVELYNISCTYIYKIFQTNKSALVSTSARLCCSCIVNDYSYTFFLNDLLCNRCCNEDSVVQALIDIHEDALYMYNFARLH